MVGLVDMNPLNAPTQKEFIWVMRHGRTALDDLHRSDGWLDLPLSDEGRQEIVEVLSEYLKHVPFTCIYCAPLRRTEETAHILQSGITTHPEIETADDAMTWNLGSLAGDPKAPNKVVVRDLLANPEKSAPDGESYEDFCERFDKWQDKQFDEVGTDGPFLEILSGSNCRRLSERLFNDRAVLDIDESGLFVLYRDVNGKWTADVITGHRNGDDLENNPYAS